MLANGLESVGLPHLPFMTLQNPVFGDNFAMAMDLIVFGCVCERTSATKDVKNVNERR